MLLEQLLSRFYAVAALGPPRSPSPAVGAEAAFPISFSDEEALDGEPSRFAALHPLTALFLPAAAWASIDAVEAADACFEHLWSHDLFPQVCFCGVVILKYAIVPVAS
jgi:hypothetical protein